MQVCVTAVSVFGCNYEEWKATYNIADKAFAAEEKQHLNYCKNCIKCRNTSGLSYTMKELEDAGLDDAERDGISTLIQLTGDSTPSNCLLTTLQLKPKSKLLWIA